MAGPEIRNFDAVAFEHANWLETVMIVAFGISWLVKGEVPGAFMKD